MDTQQQQHHCLAPIAAWSRSVMAHCWRVTARLLTPGRRWRSRGQRRTDRSILLSHTIGTHQRLGGEQQEPRLGKERKQQDRRCLIAGAGGQNPSHSLVHQA